MKADPSGWPISKICAAFAERRLTPSDYLATLLERIDRLDPAIHAFIMLDRDGAQHAAAKATMALEAGHALPPLHGIPIAIKDVIDVEGLATTAHSALRLGRVATRDAHAVTRLRAAGAIILGKLATYEFAVGGPAFDLPFPPARNPWNLDHHPGGSSSGAAAGLAANLFPGAIGTDTAGSIRNPAGACGVVGLKPTYALVSRSGVIPLSWSLDHVGPMARSVEDIALLLDVIAGHDPEDPGSARPPAQGSYAREIGRDLRGLRIGFVRHFHERDLHATADTIAMLEGAASTLAAEGAEVVNVTLPPLNDFATVNRILLQADGFAIHADDLRRRPEAFSATTRRALLPGAFFSAEDLITATRKRTLLIASVDAVFRDVDVLLTANSMEPACRIDDPSEIVRTYGLHARAPFNVTGHPALALPGTLSTGGLPLSLQLAARHFDEHVLLRVAAALEAAASPLVPPLAHIDDGM